MSLTPEQSSIVEKTLQTNSKAKLSVWDLIRVNYAAGKSFALMRKSPIFVGLPDEQLVHCLQFTDESDVTAPGCLRAAIARRFGLHSLVEIALRLSVGARFEWVKSQLYGGYELEDLFRPLLHAFASHDFALVTRIADSAPTDINRPFNRTYALILSAMIGIIRNDSGLSVAATAAMANRKSSAYVQSIQQALIAISARSATGFADALNKMLKNYAKYVYNDDIYKLVDPHAHGLVELVLTYCPDVAAEFEVNRSLPWDAEYFQWLRSINDVSQYLQRDLVPQDIRCELIDLVLPTWSAEFRESVRRKMDEASGRRR